MKSDQNRLGNYMTSRRAKGKEGLPTLSVTLERGLVRRDSLERKMETNLEANQHLRVMPGDIAYNMMRMWQGASGLADVEAIVSPAYVVLAPRPNFDSRYAAYLFKTSRMIHNFWAYSYGLTNDRLRLYPNDALKVPAFIPPLPEQRKIAEILSTWDRAIEVTEALLTTARTQKRALMQNLLTGKRRFPEFEGQEWKEVRLGDVADIRKGTQKSKLTLSDNGVFPVINGGVTASGYTDEWNAEADTITISEGGNSCGFVNRIPVRFWSGGHCYTLESTKVDKDFLFHALKFGEAEIMRLRVGSGLPNIQKKAISGHSFALPSVEEQRAISSVLNDALAEEVTHETQINCLRSEKKALMQQLLTGKRRVVV